MRFERPESFRRPPQPPHWNRGHGFCRMCGKGIRDHLGRLAARRNWHPACLELWNIASSPSYARKVVALRDQCRCAKCGVPDLQWELDHMFPLYLVDPARPFAEIFHYWGLSNMQTLCPEHHRDKTGNEARTRGKSRRLIRKFGGLKAALHRRRLRPSF